MVRIAVDEREKPSGVPDELRSKGASVEYRLVEVADYIVREYAVERKSTRDCVSSLFSGRLFDQAYRIGESYRDKILVVEGNLEFFFSSRRRHTRFDCDWSSDVCSSD